MGGLPAAVLVLVVLLTSLAVTRAGSAAQTAGAAYSVSFEGVKDKGLRKALEANSNLVSLKDKPPPSLVALQRRAEGDLPRLRRVLRSRGYYVGTADIAIDGSRTPIRVTVKVKSGPLFKLGSYKVVFTRPPPDGIKTDAKSLGLKIGGSAAAAPILSAESRLRTMLAARGHPLAKLIDRKAEADLRTSKLTVVLTMDPGPPVRFGKVTIGGLSRVAERFVRNRITWKRGARYDPRRVVETRKALVDSRLFSLIKITQAETLDAGGEMPIAFELKEAKHRSLGVGAKFSTSEGLGGEVFWEHRNLFGGGEALKAELKASFLGYGAAARFRKPDFFRSDQTLGLSAEFRDERTDAYKGRFVEAGPSVRRQIDRLHAAIVGLSVEFSSITENGVTDTFYLLGVPMTLERDNTTDRLDPTDGDRISLTLTPYADLQGGRPFAVARIGGSLYRPLTKDRRIIAAFRAAYGTVLGNRLRAIPANKRLYSGGGGSNRGYGFQMAGPIDLDGDPLGGRSLVEVGAELRIRVGKQFGIVPFIEGGRAYRGRTPD
ncbi:MAG: BamA/TamA family outer membrane protein, partial [Alphaproteobacteria bacterium]|nr:BamA/TamA family outer membrane protein [Alphaproteobacteria bacterium]